MKYVDEFRSPETARQLVQQIRASATRRWAIMEVCGGQTHSLLRHGIDLELADCIDLIHGPGCPVCVTPSRAVDLAIQLSLTPGVVLASFGDMFRVPGTAGSLQTARVSGGNLLMVYSPVDAVRFAAEHPDQHVVFFSVGFETTAPAAALAALQARSRGLKNFSLLMSNVRVLPAMNALMGQPGNRVQGFLAAGHVCCITGYHEYEEFVAQHRVPVVVTGFEPTDLLQGLLECVKQLEHSSCRVVNRYGRAVCRSGNAAALNMMTEVFEVTDPEWRGMGQIPAGGFRLRDSFAEYDTHRRFSLTSEPCNIESGCRAGDVLTGRLVPSDCPEFGRGCTPETPLGAPMVSTEGACAAYFRYHRFPADSSREEMPA